MKCIVSAVALAMLMMMATEVVAAEESTLCLAGVCLGITDQALMKVHGRGFADPDKSPVKRCYQPMAKSTFLTVYLDAEDPSRPVTGVLVSALPNCAKTKPSKVASGFTTCRQVALGDPVEKVLGLGATKRAPEDKGYPWYGTGDQIAQFDYPCDPEKACSAMASAFTMNGRVIGVSLWLNDC